jgi:YVTN family beta-propeller protein
MRAWGEWLGICAAIALAAMPAATQDDYVNYETPQVHPLDRSGDTLAACNTADNRLELFDLSGDAPVRTASIPVGYDPVSVRFRTATEAWVVNQISDTVSIVNTTTGAVTMTLYTADEPADVVFAGDPTRAFVSCSQANLVQVFNLANLDADPIDVAINGEDPRMLAVSPDGNEVYAAVFESGNRSTLLMGGSAGGSSGSGGTGDTISFPPNVVNRSDGPYNGVNPPTNNGAGFDPPKNPANGTPPRVSLIVKQNPNGQWLDDNFTDWTQLISGANSFRSGRPTGWFVTDNDVAVIDTSSLGVSYIEGMMNICMALAVNPASGDICVVGTDGLNEMRFEPVVNGVFLRVTAAFADPGAAAPEPDDIVDLNAGHVGNYTQRQIPPAERAKSLGDPRGIVWNTAGTKAYVSGMGSNNVIVMAPSGNRAGLDDTIEVQEGPTGLALDEGRGNLYVLNRFDGSISVIDLATEVETAVVPFFDPTPAVIKTGRKHLFDTHKNSGLGMISCASCHIDSRNDRLAWDLGDPAGQIDGLQDRNLGGGIALLGNGQLESFTNFHPMKGPMTTQTLVGIIGHEPFHWRGDRRGIEEFNPAFMGLQSNPVMLTPEEMQEFEDYLATMHFPPNPFRNLDNSLPSNLPLPGQFNPGDFGGAGQPLPAGNAVRGLALYRSQTRKLDQGVAACNTCHALPSGDGTSTVWNNQQQRMVPIPDGPLGQKHTMLVSIDGSTQRSLVVPHLRNMYDKVGMDFTHAESRSGFGFGHDGAIDSLARFFAEGAFSTENNQELADLVALMMAFSGSDFPADTDVNNNSVIEMFRPPGEPSKDAHAAVGYQYTASGVASDDDEIAFMADLVAGSERIELIGKGRHNGVMRGYHYDGSGKGATAVFTTDGLEETITLEALLTRAGAGSEITFTIVPAGTGVRLALDRDRDTYFDYTEHLAGTDPADPADFGLPEEGEGEGVLEGEPIEGEVEGVDEGEPVDGEGVEEGEPAEGEGEGVEDGEPAEGEGEGVEEGEPAEGEGEGVTDGEPEEGEVEEGEVEDGEVEEGEDPEGEDEGEHEYAAPAALLVGRLAQADTSGDGLISRAESGLGTAAFDALDRDGNDQLSFAELQFAAAALSPIHSGDTNANGRVSVSELLRLIQFFNAGSYACDLSTEDGYAPRLSDAKERDTACPAHASDYIDGNGAISLSELLRLVQFYNVGGYAHCPGIGDDRFCPTSGG